MLLNALIRREVKVPKGSGGRRRGWPDWFRKQQRAEGEEAAKTGANRERSGSREAERAAETAGSEAKEQAGNVDPGMEAA